MSRMALFEFLSGMGQSAARVRPFVDSLDDAAAARLLAAAEAGDNRAILRAMADQTWGTAPARAVPEAPAPTGSRSPMPFEQRVVNDPEIRRTIEAAGVPPALRAGVDSGDLQAILDSYRGAVNAEDSIRSLRRPPDQVAAESIASQFDRATGAVPERQMELPLGDEPTGLIPYGVRGPGVMVSPGAEMTPAGGSPATEMIAPSAGLGRPRLPRLPDKRLSTTVDLERMPHPRPVVSQPGPRRLPGPVGGETFPGVRVVDEARPPRNNLGRAAAAAAGLGAAAYWASRNGNDVNRSASGADDSMSLLHQDGSAVESGGAADLAAETSPPPAIAATPDVPEPTVARAPADYSFRARFLINRLNDMRMAASPEVLRANGGDVPGAATIKAEIERLLALGNEQRRTPATFVPADEGSRLYKQAQLLIDQVNQLQSQGYPHGSPQVQRLMAQVRQLQAQGDAIRNRRAG